MTATMHKSKYLYPHAFCVSDANKFPKTEMSHAWHSVLRYHFMEFYPEDIQGNIFSRVVKIDYTKDRFAKDTNLWFNVSFQFKSY